MKNIAKFTIALASLVLTFNASANDGVDPTKKAFNKWNKQFVTYTATNTQHNEQGVIYVSFELTVEGQAEKIEIEQGLSEGLNEKAKEMIQTMPKQHLYENGFIEGTRFIAPVKFDVK